MHWPRGSASVSVSFGVSSAASWSSPIAVAQTRRVLFAKQLIVETTMPMTEVALAAGFNSIRRSDATFQILYQRPPRELRRSKLIDGEQTGAEGITLKLSYAPPYDWDAMIDFLGARAIRGNRGGREPLALSPLDRTRRCARRDQRRARRSGAGATGYRSAFLKSAHYQVSFERVRRIFDLSADPLAIRDDLGRDSAARATRREASWSARYRRLGRFEVAVRAILGQQITVVAAVNLAAKLVAEHGEPLQDRLRRWAYTHIPNAGQNSASRLCLDCRRGS